MYLESMWQDGDKTGKKNTAYAVEKSSFLDVCVGGHDGYWHGDAHGSMWAMGAEMIKLLIG